MQFFTENSLYEVDLNSNMIRRLTGSKDPTPRQGKDGEWKHFVSISNIEINTCALIVWAITEDGTNQATMTSPITKIDSTVEEFKTLNN